MGIIKGALTYRRYRVVGDLPDRDSLINSLNANAFVEPISPLKKEETIGWCSAHNLLDVNFDNLNEWLYNNYAIFALRIDKKTLPAKLFKAHLEKRKQAWCKETGRERCPAKVKEELKELLEVEMLRQTLPKVNTCEVAWCVTENWFLVHSQTDSINDHIRKLFHRTFGLTLEPITPADWIEASVAERLAASASATLSEE